MKELIMVATGWWCSDEKDNRKELYGPDSIRCVDFFELWRKSVENSISPDHIVVVE